MQTSMDEYRSYVVYSKDKRPLGIVSSNGVLKAHCNKEFFPPRFDSLLTSIEDKRFYVHNGIDIKGIARASLENLKARKIVQGGVH